MSFIVDVTCCKNPDKILLCICRHIDCAQEYENQHEVGAELKKRFELGNSKGSVAGLSREDVWITSKCFNDMHKHDQVLSLLGCLDKQCMGTQFYANNLLRAGICLPACLPACLNIQTA